MLARRYFRVRCVRAALILPTDLQSMGFALPAAIGARLARPDRPVVALLGDGGFAMSGLELLTAVRERVPPHRHRVQRRPLRRSSASSSSATGTPYGTELHNPDFREIAQAAGARYERPGDDAEESLHRAVASHGVTLVEVALRDPGRQRQRVRRVRPGVLRPAAEDVLEKLIRRAVGLPSTPSPGSSRSPSESAHARRSA